MKNYYIYNEQHAYMSTTIEFFTYIEVLYVMYAERQFM